MLTNVSTKEDDKEGDNLTIHVESDRTEIWNDSVD
jgi:hypothetical protein